MSDVARELLTLEPDEFERACAAMTSTELDELAAAWPTIARPAQLRPVGCSFLLRMAGRGEGKTRSGAEDTLDIAERWGENYRGLLVSKAYRRDIEGVMLYSKAGLFACAQRRGYRLRYAKSENRLYFPGGGWANLISADSGEAAFRGPEHNHVWADEIAKWTGALLVWQNIELGLRLKVQGAPVIKMITTTPRRGSEVLYYLIRDPECVVVGGRTRDNIENIDAGAVAKMEANMAGTAFGQQELEGLLLEGGGALTSQEVIDKTRRRSVPDDLERVVVSFDPSASDGKDSDDHGIVVVGADVAEHPNGYMLGDHSIAQGAPEAAAAEVVRLAHQWGAAILVETNQGGKWVTSLLEIAMVELGRQLKQDVRIEIVPVWASKAKEVRAEPVGALYELGRMMHVGVHPLAERELTEWVPGMASPNRLDAIVHAATHLLLADQPETLTPYA